MSDEGAPEPRVSTARSTRVLVGATAPETVLFFLADQLAAMASEHIHIDLVTSPSGCFDELKDRIASLDTSRYFSVYPVPMTRSPSPLQDLVSLFGWIRVLRRTRPDVTYLGTPKASLLGTVAARLMGVRRRIYLVRGLRLEGQTGMARRVSELAERLVCAWSTDVLCVSNSLQSAMIAHRLVDPEKTHVLGRGSSNGVDTHRFHPASDQERISARIGFGIPDGRLLVGFAGRLTDDKGIGTLLAAMALVHSQTGAELVVVGSPDLASPPDADFWQDMNKSWVHHVKATGHIESLYHAVDVFCLPSRREGFPNVVLEASASGLPSVVTDATGCVDSVVPGMTGFSVPVDQVGPLSHALITLLERPVLRAEMGEAARNVAIEDFARERVWSRYRTFIISGPEDDR